MALVILKISKNGFFNLYLQNPAEAAEENISIMKN